MTEAEAMCFINWEMDRRMGVDICFSKENIPAFRLAARAYLKGGLLIFSWKNGKPNLAAWEKVKPLKP